jgi:hypothetical protein
MMDELDYLRFQDYLKDGFKPHHDPRSFQCGWCGHRVSSFVGVHKHEERISLGTSLYPREDRRDTDIRVCPECWIATTFLGRDRQLPEPILGDNLDARGKSPEAILVVALYNEARTAQSQGASSCAVLMFRKILMHIAVEHGAKAGASFKQCVNHLKDNSIVGKPQHALVDRIRDEGNDENHQIVRASSDQAADLLNLVTLLIRSVYFAN